MNTLQAQFETMLQRGIIPYLEYPIILNGEKEWLLVEIECLENGLKFSFDSNGSPVYFDGAIKQFSDNHFFLPFDTYNAGENDSEDLDYYLQAIIENIQDGFISANNLYCNDEE